MDNAKSTIDSLADIKRQKLEIQKQGITIEKLLEEMVEENKVKEFSSRTTQAKQKLPS